MFHCFKNRRPKPQASRFKNTSYKISFKGVYFKQEAENDVHMHGVAKLQERTGDECDTGFRTVAFKGKIWQHRNLAALCDKTSLTRILV
jgi:hypothetical protein